MSSWNFLKFPFISVTVGSGDSYAKNDQICKTVTIVTVVSRNNNGQSILNVSINFPSLLPCKNIDYTVTFVIHLQEWVPDPGTDKQIRLRHGGGGWGQEPEDLQPGEGSGQAGAAGAGPQEENE